MEKCPSCKRTLELYRLDFMPRPLCESCLCKNIERRVRREIRTQCPLTKGDTVVIVDDGSKEARMLEYILKRLEKDFPIKLSKSKVKNAKYALPISLDEAAVSFLEHVINKKGKKIGFAPLMVVHSEEVILFTKLKKLGGKKKLIKGNIKDHLDTLEKKHAQLKFSIIRFSKELEVRSLK